MEIMEFCQKVKRSFTDYAGEKVTVTVKAVTKNNGIVLHSITVMEKERNISPNIYLDEWHQAYEAGETFRAVMDEIMQIYEESKRKKSIDMSFFLDYEKMKDRVLYKVISYEKNRELLLRVPHIQLLDLAIVFYCFVPERELETATILIYNNHLKSWNISGKRLYQDAERNTRRLLPARLCSIEEMMREIFVRDLIKRQGEEEEPETEPERKECAEPERKDIAEPERKDSAEPERKDIAEPERKNSAEPDGEELEWARQMSEQMVGAITGGENDGRMYVLGNGEKLFGAAAMLYKGLLEAFADKIEKNLFILPSSIHEVILIPDDEEQEAEELWKMVCDINATQVEPEEVLTDSVYYFSRKYRKLEKLF